MRLWRRTSIDDIARRLRAERPQPRDEFVRVIEEEIGKQSRPPLRYRSSRLVYATALTAALLATLAGFGGLSYAASSAGSSATSAVKLVKASIGLQSFGKSKSSQAVSVGATRSATDGTSATRGSRDGGGEGCHGDRSSARNGDDCEGGGGEDCHGDRSPAHNEYCEQDDEDGHHHHHHGGDDCCEED